MRAAMWLLVVGMFGCHGPAAPAPVPLPPLVEPVAFVGWPPVTDKPIQVGPEMWQLCRAPTPEEARVREAAAKQHGPHAEYAIVVRFSPDAVAAFREGKPLPVGAVVVKEKHIGSPGRSTRQGYALMVKREAGYYPDGGDWEYAYVAGDPEQPVSRGRLAKCAGCHGSAGGRDYLFRSYGGIDR